MYGIAIFDDKIGLIDITLVGVNIYTYRCTTLIKASLGIMYSGCDKLSLQILFVYFLALSSLL